MNMHKLPTLPGFEFREQLGDSNCYRARTAESQPVIIQLVQAERLNPELVEQIRQEARVLHRLSRMSRVLDLGTRQHWFTIITAEPRGEADTDFGARLAQADLDPDRRSVCGSCGNECRCGLCVLWESIARRIVDEASLRAHVSHASRNCLFRHRRA